MYDMKPETRKYIFGGRDKSIYKLRLHKWLFSVRLSSLAVSIAHQTACDTDRIYELMLLARRGGIDENLPGRPTPATWLSMYRDHKRVFRGTCDAMPMLLGPGDEVEASMLEARALSANIGGKRDRLIVDLARDWNKNRHKWVRFCLHTVHLNYRKHLKQLRQNQFGMSDDDPNDPGPSALLSPELQFWVKVILPSIGIHHELPWTLYRRARQGDPTAIEKLIRLDDMVVHDPHIERWMNDTDGAIRRQRHGLVRLWMHKALNHGQFSIMQLKQVMSGFLAAFVDRFGTYLDLTTLKLNPPQFCTANIVSLYDAVQQDRKGKTLGVYDPDLHDIQVESLERRIRPYRKQFAALLPGGGHMFR
jgi:hypothetical protein